jgi:hypothetical protein
VSEQCFILSFRILNLNDVCFISVNSFNNRFSEHISQSPPQWQANSEQHVESNRISELSNKLNGHFLSDTPPHQCHSLTEIAEMDTTSPLSHKGMYDTSSSIALDEAPLDSHSSLRSVGSLLANPSGSETKISTSPTPQQEQSSPNTYSSYEHLKATTPNASRSSAVAVRKEVVVESSKKRDVVWLLNVLRPDSNSSRDEKKRAIVELKKWTKAAPSDHFWRLNSAQIISVLLDSFNPAVVAQPQEAAGLHSTPGPSQQTLTGLSPPPPASATLVEQTEGAVPSGQQQQQRSVAMMEAMHLACKGLLVLVKVDEGRHMEVSRGGLWPYMCIVLRCVVLCCVVVLLCESM